MILKQELIVYNVNFVSESFQNFNSDELFDVVISNASINHLNEDACIKLRESKIAKEEYRNIFRKLSKMTISGSKLIICDCSNKNFFNLIGLKNPFVPTIEWEKHQSPEVWAKLLEECGFRKEKIRWSSPNKLGKFGNLIVGNKFFSYFLSSHFCLWMERV